MEEQEIKAEQVATHFNKKIIESRKVPRKFSYIAEGIDDFQTMEYDKKLKLYSNFHTNGQNNKTVSIIQGRYSKDQILSMIDNFEIFVMTVF